MSVNGLKTFLLVELECGKYLVYVCMLGDKLLADGYRIYKQALPHIHTVQYLYRSSNKYWTALNIELAPTAPKTHLIDPKIQKQRTNI